MCENRRAFNFIKILNNTDGKKPNGKDVKQRESNPENRTVISIPKEDAVFWMDAQGRWQNRYGPFEHRKVIAYFNASIRKDGGGYYVMQVCGDIVEKVYFSYKVTALFTVDLWWQPPVALLLNTGLRLRLAPERLYILEDQLYMHHAGEPIGFAQRALMKLSEGIEFEHGSYWLMIGRRRFKLPERSDCAETLD